MYDSPALNEALSVRVLLNSVRAPTRNPDETTVVDAGSTDRTVEIVGECGPVPRIVTLRSAFPGTARNAGVAASSSEWVAFADCGTRLDPHWLEELVNGADPGVDVVYGDFDPILRTWFDRMAAIAYVGPVAGGGQSIRTPPVASCLVRNDAFNRVGGFPPFRAAEDLYFIEALAFVMLTERAAEYLTHRYGTAFSGKPIQVIPRCVDSMLYADQPPFSDRSGPVLIYIGKLGGWYWDEAMVQFAAAVQSLRPQTELQIYTQSDTSAVKKHCLTAGLKNVQLRSAPPEAIPAILAIADAGLAFILPAPSRIASSPTKVGEYLAAGLPVVSTPSIGDLDRIIADADGEFGCALGSILADNSPDSYAAAAAGLVAQMDRPDVRARCRAAAKGLFDLRTVGWPKYVALYAAMEDSHASAAPASRASSFHDSQINERVQG